MKKIIIVFILLLCGVFAAYILNMPHYTKTDTIYLNANDDISFKRLQKLSKALNNEGYRTILSAKNNFKSGLLNIYATNTDQTKPLPTVLDSKAINFLWIPSIVENMPEPLRAYDVIVVATMPSFLHLKAVNMRTAYIPEAIDIKANKEKIQKNRAMYYGNKELYSLPLYLAGSANLSVDIFGKGFSKDENKNTFIKEQPSRKDFSSYALTLVDQSDEEIAKELINPRIIEVLEQGGLPYVRYNNGLAKIFGAVLPMYRSEQEFLPKAQLYLNNLTFANDRRQEIHNMANKWNSQSQARKFSELFEVMKKKLK